MCLSSQDDLLANSICATCSNPVVACTCPMDYFDFERASGTHAEDVRGGRQNFTCPSHPGDDCLCHHFMLPDLADDQLDIHARANDHSAEGSPGFDDFASWIPRYYKPDEPCDYCQSRKLECFVTLEGHHDCSSCQSLFRQCSLTANKQHQRPSGFIDTLHGVAEDEYEPEGQATGLRALRSFQGPTLQSHGPDSPVEAEGPLRRSGARFPRQAVRILKDWLANHSERPYPSDQEKDELKRLTGLKRTQISNWLANARRRGKVPSSSNSGSSNTGNSLSDAIDINISGPVHAGNQSYAEMNPLERWKHSPPENEPASVSAIANAVASNTLPARQPGNIWADSRDSSTGSSFSMFRAPSLSSLDTSRTHRSSESDLSFGSLFSHTSQHSFGSRGKIEKVDRRRRRRANNPAPAKPGESRPFQCTFCTDTFKSKYDWQRHEKALHLSVEKWICAPQGGLVTTPDGLACAYCNVLNPSPGHLDTHNYRSCEEKSIAERTFYRKDHLRQHLRLMHDCELTPHMESWKAATLDIKSRCGFCSKTFSYWAARVDHLATHFRAGAKMADWKGTWGFEPSVLALIQNAVPPYMIAQEARTLDPFSASQAYQSFKQTREHSGTSTPNNEYDSALPASANAMMTCFQRLELALGKYVKEQRAMGARVTDGALQQQARLTIFENDDPWNETAADNAEWLYYFKVAHGLIGDDERAYGGTGGGTGGGTRRLSSRATGTGAAKSLSVTNTNQQYDWMDFDCTSGIGAGAGVKSSGFLSGTGTGNLLGGGAGRLYSPGLGIDIPHCGATFNSTPAIVLPSSTTDTTTTTTTTTTTADLAPGITAPGLVGAFGSAGPSPDVQVQGMWPTTADLDNLDFDFDLGLDLGAGAGDDHMQGLDWNLTRS